MCSPNVGLAFFHRCTLPPGKSSGPGLRSRSGRHSGTDSDSCGLSPSGHGTLSTGAGSARSQSTHGISDHSRWYRGPVGSGQQATSAASSLGHVLCGCLTAALTSKSPAGTSWWSVDDSPETLWGSSTGGSRRENPSSGVWGAGFRMSWWVRRRERKGKKKRRRRSKED